MSFRTVVSGENNQSIFSEPMFFKSFQYSAHHGIGFDDEVSIIPSFGFSMKFFIGNDRVVGGVEGKVSKKGLIFLLFGNPVHGLLSNSGQDVVRVPTFGHRSPTEATATSKWLGLDDRLSWDGDEAVPLDPAVGGEVDRSVSEVIIKALIERTVRKPFCPVIGPGPWISFLGTRFPNSIKIPAKMPFSKTAGTVSLLLEHLCNGKIIGFKDGSTEGTDDPMETSPVVLSSQQGEPAWCANTGRTMPIGEGYTLRC